MVALLTRLQSKLKLSESELAKERDHVKLLQHQLDSLSADYNAKKSETNDKFKAIKVKVEALTKELKKWKEIAESGQKGESEIVETMRNQVKEKESSIAALLEQERDRLKQIEAMQINADKRETEFIQLQNKVKTLESSQAALEADYQSYQSRAGSVLRNKQEEIEEKDRNIEALREKQRENESELNKLRAEREKVENDRRLVESAREAERRWQIAIREKDNEIKREAELQQEIRTEMEDKIRKLERKIDNERKNRESERESAIERERSAAAEFDSARSALQSQIAQKEEIIALMTEKLKRNHIAEQNQYQNQIAMMQAEMAKLREESRSWNGSTAAAAVPFGAAAIVSKQSQDSWEYLKNIIIKYMESTVESEHEKLIPVLCQLLKLSEEEIAAIKLKRKENKGAVQLFGISLF